MSLAGGGGGEDTLTHDPSYGSSDTDRQEAEDVVEGVAGPERYSAGQRYSEEAGRRMVRDRRRIRKTRHRG